MAARVGARGKRGKRPPVYTTLDDQGHVVGKKPKTPEELAADRKEQEEAEAIQLLSVVSRVKSKLVKVDAAAAALKTEKDELGDIFRSAKLQSKAFERGRIMELVKDSKPAERRNVEENEAIRYRFRRLMGLPVGLSDTEQELEGRLPDVERGGAFWFSAGYTAGVTGEKRDAPAACVTAGHDNRYDEGWRAGQAVLSQNKLAKTATTAAAPSQAEETPAQRKAREKREEEAAKTALAAAPPLDEVQASIKAETEGKLGAPLTGDESENDLTIVNNPDGCEACGQSPGFHHLEGCPVYLKATAGQATPPAIVADGFSEATAEELAAQKPREAVQAVREAAAADGDAEPTEAV